MQLDLREVEDLLLVAKKRSDVSTSTKSRELMSEVTIFSSREDR